MPGLVSSKKSGRYGSHMCPLSWSFPASVLHVMRASVQDSLPEEVELHPAYPLRLISLGRLMWPSTGPFDQGRVKAALTAA